MTITTIKPAPIVLPQQILFNTGFEGSTRLEASIGPYFHGAPDQYEDFFGIDPTVPAPNNWEQIKKHPVLGSLRLYHEGGDESQRYAKIVPDEAASGNHVLRFWIGEPNVLIQGPEGVQPKARIQAELYYNEGLRDIYQSVRVRFHPTIALLKDFPDAFNWFTLAEFWNKPFWSENDDLSDVPYPFRMSLGLRKQTSGHANALYFAVEAQVMRSDLPSFKVEQIWEEVNTDFAVPFGSWMTIESYYREGDPETGRYYVAVTPENGPRVVLFDIHDWTYHPKNPSPDGLTHYNPIKMYTSAEVVEYLRNRSDGLQVDWDDLAFWTGRHPDLTLSLI